MSLEEQNLRIEGDGYVLNVGNIDCHEFNNLISEIDLLDLPLLGRRFTQYQRFVGTTSRLDRIVISNGCWELWGTISLLALPRYVLDHFSYSYKIF